MDPKKTKVHVTFTWNPETNRYLNELVRTGVFRNRSHASESMVSYYRLRHAYRRALLNQEDDQEPPL